MADNINHLEKCENFPTEATVFDISNFLERVDENIDIAKQILALFLLESCETMNIITSASADQLGTPAIAMQAHKLKGMCKDIGGEQVASLASQLEKIKNNTSTETHQHIQIQLLTAYDQLHKEVQAWIKGE